MRPIFVATTFVAAALLFLVQPMAARMVLPRFGGTPAVWSTCLVFFQSALLAGYAYADVTTRWLRPRRQAALHLGLLLVPWLVLPIQLGMGAPTPRPTVDPAAWLLARLLARVGPPFVLVAATAPLLQRWFAATEPTAAGEPYSLYVSSNAGSLLALVAYPALVEPAFGLMRQATLWAWGYGLLSGLIVACAAVLWTQTEKREAPHEPVAPWSVSERLAVVGLAFLPSSLMLGVTSFITTDIAAVPLLWVVPLILYLVSFIFTFARREILPRAGMVHLLAVCAIVLTLALAAGRTWRVLIPVHLAAFFAAAMVCHGEVARRCPPPERLTSFYLALAAGGALGGVFNGLVAPRIFERVVEYPLGLVLACAVMPRRRGHEERPPPNPSLSRGGGGEEGRSFHPPSATRRPPPGAGLLLLPALTFLTTALVVTGRAGRSDSALAAVCTLVACGAGALAGSTYRSRPLRFALTLGAVLLASGLTEGVDGRLLVRERDFFGTLKVTELGPGPDHLLFHGRTLHGQQSFDPTRRREPLTYFTQSGPIGQVFQTPAVARHQARIAVAGLGVGSLASYARSDQSWTFLEIDPAVVSVARDRRLFTYLGDCRARSLEIVEGDARLRLQVAPNGAYDLIVLDAFSSDSVPVHLLTREAFELYRSKLARGGVLAFNLSTRYIHLEPVVGALARDVDGICRVRADLDVSPAERVRGKQPSIWAVVGAEPADLGVIAHDPRWRPARVPAGVRAWTDDRSDSLRQLRIGLR